MRPALLVLAAALSIAAAGPFKNGKGGRAASASGLANGYSLNYEGTNDTLDFGDNLTVNFSNTEWSMSLWIYATTSNFAYIAAHAAPFAGSPDFNFIFGVDGSRRWFSYFGSSGKTNLSSTINEAPLNTWYHACLTNRNGTGTYTANIWINGVKKGNDVTSPGTNTGAGYSMRVGSGYVLDNPNTLFPFVGNVDEVTFWSVGLTQAECSELYAGGRPRDPRTHSRAAALTHWYRMGDGDAPSTIQDRVGAINGTMTNMAGAANIQALAP